MHSFKEAAEKLPSVQEPPGHPEAQPAQPKWSSWLQQCDLLLSASSWITNLWGHWLCHHHPVLLPKNIMNIESPTSTEPNFDSGCWMAKKKPFKPERSTDTSKSKVQNHMSISIKSLQSYFLCLPSKFYRNACTCLLEGDLTSIRHAYPSSKLQAATQPHQQLVCSCGWGS